MSVLHQMGHTVFHFQVWPVHSPEVQEKPVSPETSFSCTIFIAWGLRATETPSLRTDGGDFIEIATRQEIFHSSNSKRIKEFHIVSYDNACRIVI